MRKKPAPFRTQTSIPPDLRRMGAEMLEFLYGKEWRQDTKFDDTIEGLLERFGEPRKVLSIKQLREYQAHMAKGMIRLPGSYWGAEMGLGKTVAALVAHCKMLNRKKIKHVLVMAPVNVAEITWPEEFLCWDFLRSGKYSFSIATGTEDQRIAALQKRAQFTFINRENTQWLVEWAAQNKSWVWDALIYDEGSRLKSGKTKSKKRVEMDDGHGGTRMVTVYTETELGALQRVRKFFKRVTLLSGTPAPEGLHDFWGQIYMVDGGKRLGRVITHFRNRWFIRDAYKHTYEAKDGARAGIMEAIKDVFFTLKSEDYGVELPPLVIRDHYVDMPAKGRKIYNRMRKELIVELKLSGAELAEDADEFSIVIEAVNRGVATSKLSQIASGAVYSDEYGEQDPDDPASKPWREVNHIHQAKIAALDSIIEEAGGKPILCAYSFQFELDILKKKYPYARVFGETKHDKKDWNQGKIKLMLVHPASVGHGMNFQYGGNITVLYGLTWSLELYLQLIKRLWRPGQSAEKVFLHRIATRNTVDETCLNAIARKDAAMLLIMEEGRIEIEEALTADDLDSAVDRYFQAIHEDGET